MCNRQRIIAIFLVAMMVMGAGCAGWGTDGPAGDEFDNESTSYDDGEAQAQEEYNESNESNDSTESSYGSDEPDSSGESTYDSGSDGESDAGAQSSSEASGDDSGESYSEAGGQDESTDETGQTGDGDSQPASGDVTCADFDSHAEAQAYYDEDREERGHLDYNNDDVPCESLLEGSEEPNEGQDDEGPYTYSLTVQVVDENGNPVENELVQFDRPSYADDDPVERITDGNGEATFQYEAETQDEYMDFTYTVRGEPRGTERVDVGEQRAQVVVGDEPRETYEMEVWVDETQPIAGVDVTIERHADGATTTKTTPEEARVTFDVYPGEYTITATYAGETHSEVVTVEGEETVFLPYQGTPDETSAAA